MKEGRLGGFAYIHSRNIIQSTMCQALFHIIMFPGHRLCGSTSAAGGFLGTVLTNSISRVVKKAELGREKVNCDTVTS